MKLYKTKVLSKCFQKQSNEFHYIILSKNKNTWIKETFLRKGDLTWLFDIVFRFEFLKLKQKSVNNKLLIITLHEKMSLVLFPQVYNINKKLIFYSLFQIMNHHPSLFTTIALFSLKFDLDVLFHSIFPIGILPYRPWENLYLYLPLLEVAQHWHHELQMWLWATWELI